MRELIQSGAITEMSGTQYVSYILGEPELFSVTEYRVLKNQNGSGLIKCSRDIYNGKIKLIYRIEGYQCLKDALISLDEESISGVLCELFRIISDVEENGFLHCSNLERSFERIYVDPKHMDVHLLYFPINGQRHDYNAFENELKCNLFTLINNISETDVGKPEYILNLLSDKTIRLKDLPELLRCNTTHGRVWRKPESAEKRSNSSQLKDAHIFLECTDMPSQFSLQITGSSFVVGKNPDKVDGVISFNQAISRVHCKFIHEGNKVYIMDLESANGTFVNEKRISTQKKVALKDGDKVKLANSNFIIRIQEEW